MLWNDSYQTGVPEMDEQHQELFRQLDILGDRTQTDRVPQVLDFLGRYVDKHFKDEERLQTASRYPGLAEHKQKHIAFVDTYKKLLDEYNRKPESQGLMTLRINRIAQDWLKTHILGPDTDFAEYYKEYQKNSGRPQATAPASSAAPRTDTRLDRPASFGDTGRLTGGQPQRLSDAEMLKRIPSRKLADELVRRTRTQRTIDAKPGA